MSSKEEHAARLSTEHVRASKQEYILKGHKASTHNARELAVLFTSLSSFPGRREKERKYNVSEL